jgi:hypothetical protein
MRGANGFLSLPFAFRCLQTPQPGLQAAQKVEIDPFPSGFDEPVKENSICGEEGWCEDATYLTIQGNKEIIRN